AGMVKGAVVGTQAALGEHLAQRPEPAFMRRKPYPRETDVVLIGPELEARRRQCAVDCGQSASPDLEVRLIEHATSREVFRPDERMQPIPKSGPSEPFDLSFEHQTVLSGKSQNRTVAADQAQAASIRHLCMSLAAANSTPSRERLTGKKRATG